MGRDIPDNTYLDTKCPMCGTQMIDCMGDDVCPSCSFGKDEGDVIKPFEIGVVQFQWWPCWTIEEGRITVCVDGDSWLTYNDISLGDFLRGLGVTLDDCKKALSNG